MAQMRVHIDRYRAFRAAAYREDIPPELRVEAFFLAAFHHIDACAARHNVHINKHQNVRVELERNERLFGPHTAELWGAFQELEHRIRPKFVYGGSWAAKDLDRARETFELIENRCRERIE